MQVGLGDACRGVGEFGGVGEDCEAAGGEAGRFIIGFDAGEEFVVLEQAAQTAPVVGDSVVAVVSLADDEGDHFALDFGQ